MATAPPSPVVLWPIILKINGLYLALRVRPKQTVFIVLNPNFRARTCEGHRKAESSAFPSAVKCSTQSSAGHAFPPRPPGAGFSGLVDSRVETTLEGKFLSSFLSKFAFYRFDKTP